MDIKLFPEIGGEDGIWIEYQESATPIYIPQWSEIWVLVKQRMLVDWRTFKAKVKKWLHI